MTDHEYEEWNPYNAPPNDPRRSCDRMGCGLPRSEHPGFLRLVREVLVPEERHVTHKTVPQMLAEEKELVPEWVKFVGMLTLMAYSVVLALLGR